jgi:RND family efflux transporter MFP subunit
MKIPPHLALAALLAAAPAACRPAEQPRPSAAAARKPRVTAFVVAPREVEYAIEATGTIEAVEELSIPARVAGIVDRVAFKEGDAVTPSSVLAEIEIDRYRLGEERARAELERAKAQAELAETLLANREKLYEEGRRQGKEWVTEEQRVTWRSDARKARADVERARVELELARLNHRDARVRPPLAGVIHRKLVATGDYVRPETVVATMLNMSALHLRFTVTELEAARLAPGQEVGFSVRTEPGREFRARLFHVSQKADPVTRAVECRGEIAPDGAGLRPGAFARVRAVTGKQTSLVVPERAILPTERGFLVYELADGRAAARPVRLGLRLDGQVEILEGLRAGARIATDGAASLRDGADVDIVEGAP